MIRLPRESLIDGAFSMSWLRFIVPGRFPVTIGHMKKPIFTSEAPAAIGPYSQGMRSGRFLFCSGQIPLDPKSGEIVSGDIAVQTRRVRVAISPETISPDFGSSGIWPLQNRKRPLRIACE